MRSLTLLGVRTPGKTEELVLVLVLAAQHPCQCQTARAFMCWCGFFRGLKNTPFTLLMRHIFIRSLKLLASHLPVQWLQDLV